MPAWQENPHPWQMRPRVGAPAPCYGSKQSRAGSVAGGRNFRRLYQAEVMTRGSDFRCLHQLAAGMTGGSQFSSFYDLHAQASLRDCQPRSRCRLRSGVTANFRYFSGMEWNGWRIHTRLHGCRAQSAAHHCFVPRARDPRPSLPKRLRPVISRSNFFTGCRSHPW